jgi:PKD repeat protein
VTGWAWTFGDGGTSTNGPLVSHAYNTAGTYTVTLTVTTGSGPATVTKLNYIVVSVAQCTVPNFVGLQTRINSAPALWGTGPGGAGFTTTIQEAAGHSNGNYKITFQSIVGGSQVACNSTITVNG